MKSNEFLIGQLRLGLCINSVPCASAQKLEEERETLGVEWLVSCASAHWTDDLETHEITPQNDSKFKKMNETGEKMEVMSSLKADAFRWGKKEKNFYTL